MGTSVSCKVGVAAATFAIDKPYTYLVPADYAETLVPGMRVIVPFGRGNRSSEAIVLSTSEDKPEGKLKWISTVLDETPVVDRQGIRLALWMREQYFCTVYDGVKAMLPAGLYYNLQDYFQLAPGVDLERLELSPQEQRVLELVQTAGGSIQRKTLREAFGQKDPTKALRRLTQEGVLILETSAQRGVGDKTEEIAMLAVDPEEALKTVSSGRSKARKAVVELLSNVGSASTKEIGYYTGAKTKTIRDLEKLGVLTLFHREVFRRPELDNVTHQPCPVLNEEQTKAYEGLRALQQTGKPSCALLYGVTGSGKTAVYINLIHRTLEEGKSALVLVPEIGLTPQLLAQFAAQFGTQIAVLHSSLAAGERYDEWKRAKGGEARVVIGTRSAVFAPLPNLGLVILDEEQESSYKSENNPRYHARGVAKYRCNQQNALLVLGSATPSVESMFFAKSGRYHLFIIENRYNGKDLPEVLIADMGQEIRAGNPTSISQTLRRELERNLQRGEQSILLLNRRGASRMVICSQCGAVPECPRCSVKLTYHKANGRLMCHYCGHSVLLPDFCPECGGELTFAGSGTQRVEEELQTIFPHVPILRMDADTISAAHPHRQILQKFEQERIPILVGTQMVAKGLDFENVTLVGVIDADLNLYVDDYRAGERTFSLLTQVIGRAGRGDRSGRAVIQTFTPKNEIIRTAARQDYDCFYDNEIALRQIRQFPPWTDLIVFTISGTEEEAVLRGCMRLRSGLESWQGSSFLGGETFQILGPAPAAVVKVNGRYRYHLTVCGKYGKAIQAMVTRLLHAAAGDNNNRGIAVSADVNPMD